jgi:hypothetical protein
MNLENLPVFSPSRLKTETSEEELKYEKRKLRAGKSTQKVINNFTLSIPTASAIRLERDTEPNTPFSPKNMKGKYGAISY